MELPVINHKDYFAKIGDDHKFPINKFGELANYLIFVDPKILILTSQYLTIILKKKYIFLEISTPKIL